MTCHSTKSNVSVTQLERAIEQARSQYFRLVILAGLPGSGKTAALQAVAETLDCQVLNVNLELSKKMLELTRTQRPQQVERLLKEIIAGVRGEVVLLDNLEILFPTTMPLLRGLSLGGHNAMTPSLRPDTVLPSMLPAFRAPQDQSLSKPIQRGRRGLDVRLGG